MAREAINPDDMYNAVQFGFSHAVAHTGSRTIECAGQVAWDKDCNLVGEGDLAAQAAQAFRNLGKVLAHAGATPADVIRQLGMPEGTSYLVVLNGANVTKAERASRVLAADDNLAIMPPLKGG